MSISKTPDLFSYFSDLEDPRIERSQRHQFLDLVVIAVCATIAGANDFVAMEKFGHSKQAWLAQFLELPNGIPSHDTFGRVLAAIDPHNFTECFLSWVRALRQTSAGQFVGIDGKTARASGDRARGQNPLHVVSAWAAANQLVLGQVAVDDKSNEITAIPKLLELLVLKGAIVTIDAMGCQKEIVTQIRAQGADYVMPVKGNQEHLEEDLLAHFAKVEEKPTRSRKLSVFEVKEKGHGRAELRRYEATPVPATLRNLADWKDLSSVCRVTRVYTERGEEKSDVRYFISSLAANAKLLAAPIRSHWGVENGLHWVLDMYFGEDRSRARAGHAAINLAQLRRWVVSLLRRDITVQGSIEKKRQQAGWNDEIMEGILDAC